MSTSQSPEGQWLNPYTSEPQVDKIFGYLSLSHLESNTNDFSDSSDGVYSVSTDGPSSSFDQHRRDRLCRLFADTLFDQIDRTTHHEESNLEAALYEEIKNLLLEFPLLASGAARNSVEHSAAVFIRHNRIPMAQQLLAILDSVYSEDTGSVEDLRKRDLIEAWLVNVQQPGDEIDYVRETRLSVSGEGLPEFAHEDESSEAFDTDPLIQQVKDFLFSRADFPWLARRISILLHTQSTGTSFGHVRRSIIDTIHWEPSGEVSLDLHLTFSPGEISYQRFVASTIPAEIGTVTVLVGTAVDAVATRAADYAECLWPGYGAECVASLHEVVEAANDSAKKSLPNITFKIDNRGAALGVAALGSATAVLEVAEAMIFIGTALQMSPISDSPAYSTPIVTRHRRLEKTACVTFLTTIVQRETLPSNAETCWHTMFKGHAIASGFPIPLRQTNQKGLEVSRVIDVSTLCAPTYGQANEPNLNCGHTMSRLQPIELRGSDQYWHYLSDEEAQELLTNPVHLFPRPPKPAQPDWKLTRHFIGSWPQASVIAGTTLMDYANIGSSQCEYKRPGLSVEKVFAFSAGKYLNISGKLQRGSEDETQSLPLQNYIDLVEAATHWMVIFSDAANSRHYMVDGATATLALCQMWLSPGQKIRSAPREFPDGVWPSTASNADTAFRVLTDDQNRKLELGVAKYYCKTTEEEERSLKNDTLPTNVTTITKTSSEELIFEQVAIRWLEILRQIRTRAQKRRKGTAVNVTTMGHSLTGFDIVDLVGGSGEAQPRTMKLRNEARDWRQLAFQNDTINIFGSNLGELIKHVGRPQMQHRCGLRTGTLESRDYLVIPFYCLDIMARKHAQHREHSLRLSRNFYLDDLESYLALCECDCESSARCTALVKKLGKHSNLSFKKRGLNSTHGVLQRRPDGAVVLGHMRNRLAADLTRRDEKRASVLYNEGSHQPPTPSGHADTIDEDSEHVGAATEDAIPALCEVEESILVVLGLFLQCYLWLILNTTWVCLRWIKTMIARASVWRLRPPVAKSP